MIRDSTPRPPRNSTYTGRVFNVLVFPGGTEIGLEINSALRDCKDIRLFSAGSDASNHAACAFARHFILPSIREARWLDALNALLEAQAIDYIFPAYDDIIVALAENADRLKAKVVSSPLETCRITRSKSDTYRHLDGAVPVPRLYKHSDHVDRYPVFVKPDRGQGSQNTFVAADRGKLEAILEAYPASIIVEHLPGTEYTIDCFSDRKAGLLFCSGRQRTRTRAGISMSSRRVADEAFGQIAEAIISRLKLHGAWFFQLKKDEAGHYKLLEVGPRIAGTMALHRVLGVNFPLLSIYEQERIPVRILTNPIEVEIDRALVNRYRHDLRYGTVYVDLDDTLILNGVVNTRVVAFLYQCVNRGVRIVLVTRHARDVDQTLKQFRLAGLFDEVAHVVPPACKSDYIREKDAILIDNSFSERRAAVERHGIPTFDCSMIEMLMDDRA